MTLENIQRQYRLLLQLNYNNSLGPLQLAVHAVHIRHAGEQGTHWDKTNKELTSLRKFGNLSIRKKLGYDASGRPKAVRTDSGKGKGSQESAPVGGTSML